MDGRPTKRQIAAREAIARYSYLPTLVSDLERVRRNLGLPSIDGQEDQVINLLRFYSNPPRLNRQLASGHIIPLVEKERRRREARRQRNQRKKRDELVFAEALKAARKIHKNQQISLRGGYIYVVVNPSYPGWLKVGCTVDLNKRLQTYQTSDPHRAFEFRFKRFVPDRRIAERMLIEELRHLDILGEWVKTDFRAVVEIFRKIQKKLLTP